MYCNAFDNKILITEQPCCILNQLDFGRDAAGRTDRDQIRNSLWINSNDSLSISGQSLTLIFGQYLVNNNSASASIFVKDVPIQWTQEATVTYGRALLSRVASDCEQVHDTIGLDNKNFFQ